LAPEPLVDPRAVSGNASSGYHRQGDKMEIGFIKDDFYKCPDCDRSYAWQKNLNKHIRKDHPNTWKKWKTNDEIKQAAFDFKCALCS